MTQICKFQVNIIDLGRQKAPNTVKIKWVSRDFAPVRNSKRTRSTGARSTGGCARAHHTETARERRRRSGNVAAIPPARLRSTTRRRKKNNIKNVRAAVHDLRDGGGDDHARTSARRNGFFLFGSLFFLFFKFVFFPPENIVRVAAHVSCTRSRLTNPSRRRETPTGHRGERVVRALPRSYYSVVIMYVYRVWEIVYRAGTTQ